MGKPKLSNLKCNICNVKFEKKSLLDEHMKSHLSSSNQNRQLRKHLKEYCYTCRKTFDHDAFKLHIETEHPFDFPKKIKKENHSPKKKSTAVQKNKSFNVSVPDIKTEPVGKISDKSGWTEHQKTENKKSIQKKDLKVPKLKCSICGMRCKGKKGLKIHMCAHNRSQANSDSDTSQSENNDEYDLGEPSKNNANSSLLNNSSIPFLISNNRDINFIQNAQPNYILNASHIHNPPNNLASIGTVPNNILQFGNQVGFMNAAIQPYAHFSQSVPNQNTQPSDNIPRFDFDSDQYMEWLRNFVSKCQMHGIPLSNELCRQISSVTEEVLCALACPTASLRNQPNHSYLRSIYNTLSDLKLKHLRSRLCSKKK